MSMSNYRHVCLLQNKVYPTYQLYALMADPKTSPQDGLRLAALTTMDWLRDRLGEHVPEELNQLPELTDYKSCGDDCLPSLHINAGYVVDIISLPEQGLWSLMITEPDLGSDPGNPQQARQAVPGRVFETNIAFHVLGKELECGFKLSVSDPEGTETPAEVYRPIVVRRLIDHPDFGLKQVTPLTYSPKTIGGTKQLKAMYDVWRDDRNHLPIVVFTAIRETPKQAAPIPLMNPTKLPTQSELQLLKTLPMLQAEAAKHTLPYDAVEFAKYGIGYCRTYILQDDSLLPDFSSKFGIRISPGDIAVLEPPELGGKVQVFGYKINPNVQKDIFSSLKKFMYRYPMGKPLSFGRISFLSAAREHLLQNVADTLRQADETSDQWRMTLAALEGHWKDMLKQKDSEYAALQEQLKRQRQYQHELERNGEELRRAMEALQSDQQEELAKKEEEIVFLHRKLDRPKAHGDIAVWVAKHFSDRLILHARAESLLEKRSAQKVDIDLICDALDYLATDYRDYRYRIISKEEMYMRCSLKYGRPFEVTPTNASTIRFTPEQYRIKYFCDEQGKPTDSDLTFHLKVGNDPENLLRIYFLLDDKKQLIVVGSLPQHLKTITIQ